MLGRFHGTAANEIEPEELVALEFADWFSETLRVLVGGPELLLAPATRR